MCIQKNVGRAFISLGLPVSLSGYYYAKESVVCAIENPSVSNKVILASVAKKFNTDVQNVERCIRTFIDRVWRGLVAIGLFVARPSCREFIFKCAEVITLGLVDEVKSRKFVIS